MPQGIFYPDADPETSSVDGEVAEHYVAAAGVTWANIIIATGSTAADNLQGFGINIKAATGANLWMQLRRWILLFDTSSIPATADISSATLSIYGYGKEDFLSILPNCNVYSSNPASNTSLVAGDFDSLGLLAFCDSPIAYNDWNTSGMNSFVLNADGLAAITKAGITKLGIRNVNYDVDGVVPPNWISQKYSALYGRPAEKGGGYRPRLIVNYTDIPTVTTNAATVISLQSATLNGSLTDDGGLDCDCGFEWGLTVAYGHISPTSVKNTGESFAYPIAGLLPNTTYHFRAFGINTIGTGYGADTTFTTGAGGYVGSEPIVTLEALRNLEMAGQGRFYIDDEGNAKYESRFHRSL